MALKNYDYIYTIGHSHRTCDDFAYSYSCDGFNISIVCDGCSSAKNSDIGARMIASNFIVEFKTRIKSERESCISSSNIISSLENTIKKTYIDYKDIYGDEFLASTIMVAISTNEFTVVYSIGDGIILQKYNNGDIRYINIEFDNNAPGYLSYIFNDEIKRAYLDFSKSYTEYNAYKHDGEYNITENTVSMTDIPVRSFVIWHDEIKYLMLFTDGLTSFTDKNKDISYYVEKMLDVKNDNGVFLKRQVTGVCRDEERNENYHQDDLSGIALIFE